MIEKAEREIDGITYVIHQLPAKAGRHMLVRLTKILGPAMGQLAESKGDDQLVASVAGALREISSQISEKDFDWICETFGGRTEVKDGLKLRVLDLEEQEDHFAGAYGRLFKWLAACLEVNYKDFIGILGTAKKGLEKGTDKPGETDLEAAGGPSFRKG